MELKEALEVVVNEATGGFADYAKTYAKAALELGGSEDAVLVETDCRPNVLTICPKKTGNMMMGEEMRVQVLYVLSNLSGWRGLRAKEVKAVLKQVAK